MTFRANFQTTPENHSWYFIALTQMVFPSWILTRFVSWTLSAHSKETQSVFRRFKTYHYWAHSKAVCAPELRNQFQKASCVQKAFIIGISLLPPKVEVQFPKDSALNQVSILEILCQNWIIFIWWEVGVEMARDKGCAFHQAQMLFKEELYSGNIITSPGFG